MNTMPLKNPLNHYARENMKPLREMPYFREVRAHCAIHGDYPLNMQDHEGIARWYSPHCPMCTKQKRAQQLLAESRIPPRFIDCRFDNYSVKTEAQQRVLDCCKHYADHFKTYHTQGSSLLLCGAVGTGKNHLSTAIIREIITQGYSALHLKASQYLDAYWAKDFQSREAWLFGMASVDLLIIDEVGRSSPSKAAQDALFRLIDARYELKRPNLLLTNLNREALIHVLGHAIYDRLTEGGGIRLTLDWPSERAYPHRLERLNFQHMQKQSLQKPTRP